MKKEELAARLNGREYGREITDAEEAEAKESGLVVLFGASDDLAEFRGAISDEAGCYGGDDLILLDGDLFRNPDCDCKWAEAAAREAKRHGRQIAAVWSEDGFSWTYKTAIPHATFEVLEDGDKYCRGIVFSIKDAR